MKKTVLLFAFSALFLGSMVSCKKDDDKKETTPTTTPTPTPNNPLATVKGKGRADITVGGVKDTMYTMEDITPVLNLFAIYCSGVSSSLHMQTGDNKLPAANKTYNVQGDYEKLPSSQQVILNYYDDKTEKDFYATGGEVSYTLTSTEKIVKFDNITFKSEDNTLTKVISFEVKLK